MKPRLGSAALALTVLLLDPPWASANDQSPFQGLLTGFSFETDEHLETGPDTLAVFAHGRGQVSLGSDFRTSGLSAVVLRDVPHDGDFPELQGFFEEQREGRVWLHFDLLLTTTEHEMNIALAGPSGFGLGRDGISFWLTLRNGWLVHISDGIPRRLTRPQPFTWSTLDVALDLDKATYDLYLTAEGSEEPVVALTSQPTAARHVNAAIDKFSFIGDRGNDSSAVEYWIDDVVVATEDPVNLPDFVAPGRRRTFVERLSDIANTPKRTCPPILGQEDFAPQRTDGDGSDTSRIEEAWQEWLSGCAALSRGDQKEALHRLSKASRLVPESMPYSSATALALMANDRLAEAEEVIALLASRFQSDPRYPIVVASVAEANQDVDLSEQWLRDGTARDTLSLTAYYGLLLRRGDFEKAWDVADELARRVAEREEQDPRTETLWWERAGDAAYLAGATINAEELYRYALDSAENTQTRRLLLKLSDVLWTKGDVEGEKALRESVYGRLVGLAGSR